MLIPLLSKSLYNSGSTEDVIQVYENRGKSSIPLLSLAQILDCYI